jgi:hypothetical protein
MESISIIIIIVKILDISTLFKKILLIILYETMPATKTQITINNNFKYIVVYEYKSTDKLKNFKSLDVVLNTNNKIKLNNKI